MSPGTIEGSLQRAERRQQRAADHAKAEAALQAWRELQQEGAKPQQVALAPVLAENSPPTKLVSSVSTRFTAPSPRTIVLQPMASLEQVADAYGMSIQSLHAAQARQKRAEMNLGHDRRQIGTSQERLLLAEYAEVCGASRLAQTRADLTDMLWQMLDTRKLAVDEGKIVPPLSAHETAFHASEPGLRKLSDEFWRFFEVEFNLKLANSREQELNRSIHYTEEACRDHFQRLLATLRANNFLYTKGSRKDEIRDESELAGALDAAQMLILLAILRETVLNPALYSPPPLSQGWSTFIPWTRCRACL